MNTVEELQSLYHKNEKFRNYVNKFANDYDIKPAIAITYKSVINYAEYLKETENVKSE